MVRKNQSVNIDNFDTVESMLNFEEDGSCFYKFCIIVRNKDGISPLIGKKSASGETMIKMWLIESREYYNKVKPEMIALAKATRGRLYFTLDRKSVTKVTFALHDYASDVMKRMLTNDNTSPKRLNKVMNKITSDADNSDNKNKYWLYDIDSKNGFVLMAIREFLGQRSSEVYVLPTVNGYHVVARRDFKPSANWAEYCCDLAIKYMRDDYPKASVKAAQELWDIFKEVKVEPNQLGLVFYSNEGVEE